MEKEENMSETVKTIIYAIVIAVLIRSFLFEPFKIPSGSMSVSYTHLTLPTIYSV